MSLQCFLTVLVGVIWNDVLLTRAKVFEEAHVSVIQPPMNDDLRGGGKGKVNLMILKFPFSPLLTRNFLLPQTLRCCDNMEPLFVFTSLKGRTPEHDFTEQLHKRTITREELTRRSE